MNLDFPGKLFLFLKFESKRVRVYTEYMVEPSSSNEFYVPQFTTPVKTTEGTADVSVKNAVKSPEPFVAIKKPLPMRNRREWFRFRRKKDPTPSIQVENKYSKISDHHGRSVVDTAINSQVIWGDEYGTVFGAKDWKGASMQLVYVTKDQDSSSGLRVNGLKEKNGLDRIGKASVVLRKAGLPTEVPIQSRKVQEIYYGDKFLSVDEWKDKTLKYYDTLAASWRKSGKEVNAQREEAFKAKAEPYLQNAEFYIIERDLQVAERLRDIEEVQTEQDFVRMMDPVLRWFNAVIETRGSIIPDTEGARPCDINNPEDIKRYFGEWLPSQMGVYLGRLHKFGIAHGFPHGQNWSAVGTLYDLDSVHGKPIGDDLDPVKEDYEYDIQRTKEAITVLLTGEKTEKRSNYLSRTYPGLSSQALKVFLNSYVAEGGIYQDIAGQQ